MFFVAPFCRSSFPANTHVGLFLFSDNPNTSMSRLARGRKRAQSVVFQ